MDADDPIRKEVFINAPAKNVFAFFVDPAKITAWMGQTAEVDPQPGGIYRVVMSDVNIARGEFVEVVPYERVVFTWGWEGSEAQPAGCSTVEITLAERDGGTFVRLEHRGLAGEARTAHDGGWAHHLGGLAAAVEEHVPE